MQLIILQFSTLSDIALYTTRQLTEGDISIN